MKLFHNTWEKWAIIICFTVGLILGISSAKANELLMAHNPMCGICQNFLQEVGVDYEYEDLPLVIINLYNQPNWFKEAYAEGRIKPIRGTPTFILWNEFEKYEVDRIVGYGGKDWFYYQLKEMLAF